MARTRRGSLVFGTSLAASFAALALLVGTIDCASQEVTLAPDAAPPPCERGPFVFCTPVGAEVPSCSSDDKSHPLLDRLPRATRYPVDCPINFVGERDDVGDCKLDAVCKCVLPDTTNPPVADAGARDGGDASTPPRVDAGPSIPTWSCL